MFEMFFGRQFFSYMIYFACIGLVTDEIPDIKLILQYSFYACIFP